jgi:hypothetical protein
MYFAMKDTNERKQMCTITNKYKHTKDVALAFARATLLVLINVHVSLDKNMKTRVLSRNILIFLSFRYVRD